MSNSNNGWIGVDLDGTLAYYDRWRGTDHIGAPIQPMVERVKQWLDAGKTVKIFTARMHGHGMPIIGGGVEDVRTPIEAWCKEHIGAVLEITNVKDFGMIELWDDRAIQVESNTGIPVAECICEQCNGNGWYPVQVGYGIGVEQEQCEACQGTGRARKNISITTNTQH